MIHIPGRGCSDMDRRQVLAGLAASLTLGSGCLEMIGSDNSGDSNSTAEPDESATGARLSPGSTRTETEHPTPSQTAASDTSTDSSSLPTLVDAANRKTYTNDGASYSINYPAKWQATGDNSKTVRFTDPDSSARMLVRVKDGVPRLISRETIITTAIQRAKRRYSIDRVTRVDQQEVTLPNGTPGTVVKARLSRSTSDTLLRGTFLVVHVTDTVYAAGIFVPEHAFTRSVDRAMVDIVTSLTIQDTDH